MKKVVVVGAGPGGIAAAVTASELGSDVSLIDENPGLGGQIWRQNLGRVTDKKAKYWIDRLKLQDINFIPGTTVIGGDEQKLICSSSDQRHKSIEYDSLILATGAKELFLPFPGWTLPNVLGCGGAQALVKAGLDIKGKKVVVSGSGPLLLAVAYFLKKKGAHICGIYEQAQSSNLNSMAAYLALNEPAKIVQGLKYRLALSMTPWKKGWWVKSAHGSDRLNSVTVTDGRQERSIDCDYLACGFGLVPNTELAQFLGCNTLNEFVEVNESQQTSKPNIYAIGELTGIGGLDKALLEGEISANAVHGNSSVKFQKRKIKSAKFTQKLNETFRLREEVKNLANAKTIFCRCEDVSFEKVESFTNQRDAKLKTRCGMGACQGRICSAMGREIFGWETNKVNFPLSPVSIDSLID